MDKWVDVFPLNADLFGKMASITVSDDVNANTIQKIVMPFTNTVMFEPRSAFAQLF